MRRRGWGRGGEGEEFFGLEWRDTPDWNDGRTSELDCFLLGWIGCGVAFGMEEAGDLSDWNDQARLVQDGVDHCVRAGLYPLYPASNDGYPRPGSRGSHHFENGTAHE